MHMIITPQICSFIIYTTINYNGNMFKKKYENINWKFEIKIYDVYTLCSQRNFATL